MYKHFFKRVLDIVLGLIALPFVLIVFIVFAPMIYLEDKGPVFYNAPRVGKNGKPFVMYKFRSMYVNAPDLKMEDGSTYNGADDLPQFLNVLKGDMSIIGPRPDLDSEMALYQGDEGRKLEVTPGITGYAQAYGRNSLPWHDRLALDVYYVDHLSFLLDVKIFFKTFATVFKQEGIYVEQED